MTSNAAKNQWPDGVFTFKDWYASLSAKGDPQRIYNLAERAFEAGYVSAVRHHDAAMLAKAEWDSPEDAVYDHIEV